MTDIQTYCYDNPITASVYIVLIILVSALAAFKCKGCLKRMCNRRRNRRRRKPRTHFYYLNKSSADPEANSVAESLIDSSVQLGRNNEKKKGNNSERNASRSKRNNGMDLSLLPSDGSIDEKAN